MSDLVRQAMLMDRATLHVSAAMWNAGQDAGEPTLRAAREALALLDARKIASTLRAAREQPAEFDSMQVVAAAGSLAHRLRLATRPQGWELPEIIENRMYFAYLRAHPEQTLVGDQFDDLLQAIDGPALRLVKPPSL